MPLKKVNSTRGRKAKRPKSPEEKLRLVFDDDDDYEQERSEEEEFSGDENDRKTLMKEVREDTEEEEEDCEEIKGKEQEEEEESVEEADNTEVDENFRDYDLEEREEETEEETEEVKDIVRKSSRIAGKMKTKTATADKVKNMVEKADKIPNTNDGQNKTNKLKSKEETDNKLNGKIEKTDTKMKRKETKEKINGKLESVKNPKDMMSKTFIVKENGNSARESLLMRKINESKGNSVKLGAVSIPDMVTAAVSSGTNKGVSIAAIKKYYLIHYPDKKWSRVRLRVKSAIFSLLEAGTIERNKESINCVGLKGFFQMTDRKSKESTKITKKEAKKKQSAAETTKAAGKRTAEKQMKEVDTENKKIQPSVARGGNGNSRYSRRGKIAEEK